MSHPLARSRSAARREGVPRRPAPARMIGAAVLALVVGTVGAVVPAEPARAAAAGDLVVTRVPGADPRTSAGFAWQAPVADVSATGLAWGPAEEFDCAGATVATATPPSSGVVDSKVTYAQLTLTELRPGTEYAYCAVAGEQRSATSRFSTEPERAEATTVLAFGNASWRSSSSYQNAFAGTLEAAHAAFPDAGVAIHTGVVGSSNDLSHWRGFLDHAGSALGAVSWMPTAQTSGSGNRSFARGNVLPVASNGNDSADYAVVHGGGLFLTLNSYLTSSANTSATTAWIAERVAEFRADHPDGWVIVSIPTQFYGSSASSSTYRTALQQAFRENDVALVLQGGAAAYTRSWPVGRDTANTLRRDYPAADRVATADGIVYLTPGASGIEQAAVSSSALNESSGWLAVATPTLSSAERTAAGMKTYTAITVTDQALTVQARTAAGAVLDTFTIDRGATPEVAPYPLEPFGLTNGFGTDAATERVITWLAPKAAGLTNPQLTLSAVGDQTGGEPETSCTESVLTRPMTGYVAYTCTATGLLPGTSYDYRVGAWKGERPYQSDAYTFRTDGGAESFTFLDFADTQSTPVSTYDGFWGNALRTALAAHPDAAFVVQNGDLTETTTESHVAAWLGAVGTDLSGPAFNPVLGNHDESSSVQAMWSTLFPRDSRITVPDYGKPAALQYSVVYGNALFLYVNTNLDSTRELRLTDQWIRDAVAADGKNPDGSERFIIVVEHKSPFGGSHSGSGSYPTGDYGNPRIVAQLPKTFDEVGVDLVLAGHDHNLIRSLPIRWNHDTGKAEWDRDQAGLTTIDSRTDGLVYFIPRNAGQKTYSAISTPSASSRPWIASNWAFSDRGDEQPENDVYAAVTVTDSEIQVAAHRVGDTTTPLDRFTITKSPEAPVSLSTPTIEGAAEAGAIVTAAVTADPPTADLDYEWLRDGEVVRSASPDASYVIQPADAGHELSVRVTGSARKMTATTVTSDPVPVDPEVRIWASFDRESWQLDDAAAGLAIGVSTSCREWKVTDDASWLSQSPSSGTTDRDITVSASRNTGSAARTGTVTVTGCGMTGTLTVTQAGRAALSASASSWAAPVLGGDTTVQVSTNQSGWTASVPTAASWLSVTGSGLPGEPLAIIAQPNTGAARSAVITLNSGSASTRVTVSQAAVTLGVSSSSWSPSRGGASRAIKVTASAGSWQIDPASVPTWLSVDRLSGADGEWFVLRADRNLGQSRSAAVTLTSATATRTVTVSQATASTATVSASPSSWSAPAGAGARAVTVTTNGHPWQATVDQDWVHLGATSGTTGAVLVLGADPNTTSAARTATVTLTAGPATRTVKVTQPGNGSGAGFQPLAPLPATGGTSALATGLTGTVTVSDDASWLTSSASGGDLSLTATANTGKVRTSLVTVRASGSTAATAVVLQEGVPSISAGSATWSPSRSGASTSRTVTSSQWDAAGAAPIAATSDAEWLRVPSGAQESGTSLTIAADPNTSGAARAATVTLSTAAASTVITVTQPG